MFWNVVFTWYAAGAMDGPGSPVDHEVDVEGEGGEQEEDAHHNPHQG